jgi:signal transduction histidine kinase/phage shock protein PspC (stress-responsive transcriptional regulator)
MTELEVPVAGLASRKPRPSLRRSRDDRRVAGVAAGIGDHLGVDHFFVRMAFLGLALAAGFGVVVYLLLWLLVPNADPTTAVSRPATSAFRPGSRYLLGGGLIVLGFLILLWVTGFWFGEGLAWPVSLAAIGFVVLWARGGTEEGRSRVDLAGFTTPLEALLRSPGSRTRALAGGALIVAGMTVFLAATTSLAAAANVILAVLVTAGGLALFAGPWLWRLATDLMDERTSRIRSEARAEMAAHLHDSVLQTLALIQRAKEPREMTRLARTQERELRAWLYGRSPSVRGARLRDAIDAMAGSVERRHGIEVEAIVVGDAELDEGLRALVSATNEATLNAAKHSRTPDVSVYVEVEDGQVTAYVRDQGAGFDPGRVPGDRRGIADSIVRRMARHGGSAEIRSQEGAGTEVILRLPRR